MGGLASSVLAAQKIESDFSSVQVYYYKFFQKLRTKRQTMLIALTLMREELSTSAKYFSDPKDEVSNKRCLSLVLST